MDLFLAESINQVSWPQDIQVSSQIRDNGKTIFIDVDLPEIEDMPRKEAKIASTGFKLNIKETSDTQNRKNYMDYVHAIGFRIIGEAFVALPKADIIILSGYSQRVDQSTGETNDDYLYSIKVKKEEWRRLNFENIKVINPTEALGKFEIIRKMTKAGVFTKIKPFE